MTGGKIVTAAEAAALVASGATLLVDGSGGGVNEPGAVLARPSSAADGATAAATLPGAGGICISPALAASFLLMRAPSPCGC